MLSKHSSSAFAFRLFSFFLIAWTFTCCSSTPASEVQTLYLIRQAEKDTLADDPPLLPKGEQRALLTAEIFRTTKFDRIYSTATRRNLATVAPLAEAQQVEVKHYEWHDWQPMLREITAAQGSLTTVLICGHGDNLLPMIAALGCTPPLDSLGAHGHDVYFKVELAHGECRAKALQYPK